MKKFLIPLGAALLLSACADTVVERDYTTRRHYVHYYADQPYYDVHYNYSPRPYYRRYYYEGEPTYRVDTRRYYYSPGTHVSVGF